jgi:hypothetical protein
MELTIRDAVNRGYNMLACTILALAGLAFGTVVIEEKEWTDRFDDGGLLIMGAIAVIWYLVGGNRFKRSIVPIVLTAVALIVQLSGVLLEHDDPSAFGDNIGGMWLFVPLLAFLIVQYVRNGRYQAAARVAPATSPTSEPAEVRV